MFLFIGGTVVISAFVTVILVYAEAFRYAFDPSEFLSSFYKAVPAELWWLFSVGVPGGIIFGAVLYGLWLISRRSLLRRRITFLDQAIAELGATNLQETLQEDFFTKLVKINFTYIERYYRQTQEQANRSFLLSAVVSVIGLAVIIAGIVLLYQSKIAEGSATAAAGILGEFIASVFFYLFNQTVLKMSEYHQKLVITQNIGIALKIVDTFPETAKVTAQEILVERLTEDVNWYLVHDERPTSSSMDGSRKRKSAKSASKGDVKESHDASASS